MTGPDMRAHAIAYAFAGHPVLPLHWPLEGSCSCRRTDCPSPAKHPLTGHGKDDATTDVATVAAWWDRWPEANVGLRPSPGLVVVDVDPRSGGASSLVALLAGRTLPETWTADTGGGGLHAWYRCGGELRGELCPGVDLKGPGGYVVAPPSLHMSGRRYEWATELPTVPAPDWLATAIRRPPPAPRPVLALTGRAGADRFAGLVRTVTEAPQGMRNSRLHWAACRAIDEGADVALLDQLAQAALGIGLTAVEVQRTIRSAQRGSGQVNAA